MLMNKINKTPSKMMRLKILIGDYYILYLNFKINVKKLLSFL